MSERSRSRLWATRTDAPTAPAPTQRLDYQRALRASVAAGEKGYGFTLVIWTTGALTVAEQRLPDAADVLAFLFGAVGGMTLIVVACFGGLRSTWSDVQLPRQSFGAIRALSVLAAVLVGWGVAAVLDGPAAFGAAAFTARFWSTTSCWRSSSRSRPHRSKRPMSRPPRSTDAWPQLDGEGDETT